MQIKARVLGQPRVHTGVLVGGVVVHDEVDVEVLGDLVVERTQEPQELLVTVTGGPSPITTPVSTLSAADNVVVPFRL